MNEKKIYDIICIGAGSGGLNIASFMNKIGFKVLLIDKTDKNIGGDCLNFGCIPSKSLIHISRLFNDAKKASEFGLRISGIADIKKVMDYITSKKEIIREHENAEYFRKKGMDVVLGEAKFLNNDSVIVNNDTYSGKKIIIATGSRPRKLNIPGIENLGYGTSYLDNEIIFNINKLPDKLVVIGGGPIGIELGQAFSRLGSKVTVINRRKNCLGKECSETSDILIHELIKEGIEFKFNSEPKQILNKNQLLIETKINDSKKQEKIDFDAILVGIGRELNLDLDLEKAGIELFNNKIKVDDYLRTTNKKVLVCGDVAGSYQFTHAAELHASIILNNFFSPIKKKINYDKFSWVTYTDPEIASWGLNENQLEERKLEYKKLSLDLDEDDRSITDEVKGKLILFISKNKILGGTLVRRNAGEIAQELILATHSDLDIKHIFSKIYAYPTASRINKKIIADLFSGKLTPFTIKLLKLLYH